MTLYLCYYKYYVSNLIVYCFIYSSMKTNVINDQEEVSLAAKQILNNLRSRRVIGRPEAIHSSLNLPLTICSEHLVEVRISPWKALKGYSQSKDRMASKDIYAKYSLRTDHLSISLWEYFNLMYNTNNQDGNKYIPFSTGMNSKPVYPVTVDYAKATLVKHFPWSEKFPLQITSQNVIATFEEFLHSIRCPLILKTEYDRVKAHYKSSKIMIEPTNHTINSGETVNDYHENMIDSNDNETVELLRVMNSFTREMKDKFEYKGYSFDIGLKYNWSERKNNNDTSFNGITWLMDKIEKHSKIHASKQNISIPKQFDGTEYCITNLTDEQSKIAYIVLSKIEEWLTFPENHKKRKNTTFKPLRLTVVGCAGTGKSYLINTLITQVRKLTKFNDSVIVTGPTGKCTGTIY